MLSRPVYSTRRELCCTALIERRSVGVLCRSAEAEMYDGIDLIIFKVFVQEINTRRRTYAFYSNLYWGDWSWRVAASATGLSAYSKTALR
jgi:hypothetical protein